MQYPTPSRMQIESYMEESTHYRIAITDLASFLLETMGDVEQKKPWQNLHTLLYDLRKYGLTDGDY